MKNSKLHLIPVLLTMLSVACTSNQHVLNEYQERLRSDRIERTTRRTVVFFLIDGLSIATLQSQLSSNATPKIKNFFLGDSDEFDVARTSFPSLTFPAVGSLISERSVDQNGIYGNILMSDDGPLDLQSPLNLTRANQMIEGSNIFARLKAKGLTSVSLDYNFYANSDAHIEINDVEVAKAIQGKNYSKVDHHLINSLEVLLSHTNSRLWPDFVFVHLIGIDFLSHEHGSQSPTVVQYLKFLDQELTHVFEILSRAENTKQRDIVALLSSDHGFDGKVTKTLNIEQLMIHLDPHIQGLNEGRYAALVFPDHWTLTQQTQLLGDLISQDDIDIVALREHNQVLIWSHQFKTQMSYGEKACQNSALSFSLVVQDAAASPKKKETTVNNEWHCPGTLPENLNQLYHPYFLSNISQYFQSPGHPTAVIIAKPGVAFKSASLAYHGGPTKSETLVPLLLHRATIHQSTGSHIPALWELLQFM